MEIGKRYIVTKASDDRTFEVGDEIGLDSFGGIVKFCETWNQVDDDIEHELYENTVEKCDVEKATKGMEVITDQEWYNNLA